MVLRGWQKWYQLRGEMDQLTLSFVTPLFVNPYYFYFSHIRVSLKLKYFQYLATCTDPGQVDNAIRTGTAPFHGGLHRSLQLQQLLPGRRSCSMSRHPSLVHIAYLPT